ncbi:MAG: acetylglutamate kinase [Deltaproteobacteria bacterium]|jgi:acetylglutamate kinase|nr:acetylglutamate kinase [Deltaproteobacteria bacterium]
MQKLIDKATILMEALPYIRRFYQKTIVIKYGGHAMADQELKKDFAMDITLMNYIGLNPVVVHGGGPQIEEVLKKMGKSSRFVDGLRVTDEESMEVVEMVLVGKINKEIVKLINQQEGKAVGLSGKDGSLITAKKLRLSSTRSKTTKRKVKDMGLVGEVETINPHIIETLDRNKFIPVIAPIGVGKGGETYNINADMVAGKIASALNAEKLILLTDTAGVLDKRKKLISSMNEKKTKTLIKKGEISGGMIPKVTCCLQALKEGVAKAHIIDGRIKHAVLLEIFTDVGIGTQITG